AAEPRTTRAPPPPGQSAAPAAWPTLKTRPPRTRGRGAPSDQLQQHHLGRVRSPRPQLQDPRIAAGPLGVARRDLLEQLVDHELVLPKRRQGLSARVQVTALGQRDQLLELGL